MRAIIRRRANEPLLDYCRRIARPEIFDQPQQHARGGVGIGRIDMLVRMVADAATASHEQHADVGDVDHRHAVMAGAARQFEHGIAFRRDGCRHLRLQPRRARHGAVFVRHVDLQRELAALCDRFDLPDDVGHGTLAVRIGRRAKVHGEVDLPRDHVGGSGLGMDISDRADQSALVGAA